MTLRIFQKGFNFRQDGPGHRLVCHLQGCNLRCPWCSNPEGLPTAGGTTVEVGALVAECGRCRKFFLDGGGVTFTGGEATLQDEALLAAMKALRAEGISTALETNGTSPRLAEIAGETDYLMLDFKHVDGSRFAATCGEGFAELSRNYAQLASGRRQLHVRIPLVNGFNADAADAFAEYFAARPHKGVVYEFLRYHEYGKAKWRTPYAVKDGFVSDEQVSRFVRAFAAHGLGTVST